MIDAVLVPDHKHPMHGVWINGERPLSKRDATRLIEMVAGRERLRAAATEDGEPFVCTPVHTATPEQWMRLIGLAVVEQAVRAEI